MSQCLIPFVNSLCYDWLFDICLYCSFISLSKRCAFVCFSLFIPLSDSPSGTYRLMVYFYMWVAWIVEASFGIPWFFCFVLLFDAASYEFIFYS